MRWSSLSTSPCSRSRRAVLAAVATLPAALAGCSSVSPTPGAAVSPPDCERAVDELPRPASANGGDVAPVRYPTPPAEWTREATRAFALDFERAYVTNRTLAAAGSLTYLEFDPVEASTVNAPSGYVLRGRMQFAYGSPRTPDDESGTPVTIHADSPYRVALYVTPHSVVRSETTVATDRTPDVDAGEVLLCRHRGTIQPRATGG